MQLSFDWMLNQVVKLNKQLESSSAEHSKLILDYEVQIRELNNQLTAANEAMTRLETQNEETRRRASMDVDERIGKLQDDLQVQLGNQLKA